MSYKDCIDAVQKAANGKLNDDEIAAVFEAVDRKKKRLEAEGKVDGLNVRLAEAMREEGEKARVLAAMQRKHAALNAIARDRIETHIANLQASGMRPDKALLALMEGSQVGVEGARKSVHATKLAYEAKFIGGMIAELEKTRPHLVAMLHDEKFNSDITREMFELREGGSPGKTGNEDAKAVAKIFATYAEVSRTELNRLGSAIGKLDGWAGPQSHDDIKMLKAGEDAWIAKILPHLDIERSFPDVKDSKELEEILRNVYLDIVTGRDRSITAQQKGEFTSPANLAKKLGEHRVLHFKSADDWIAYREAFGYGNAFSAMVSHQRRAAALAGQMDIFGPNPAVMLGSVVDSLALKVRHDASLDAKAKQKIISKLEVRPGQPGGAIADAYLEMAGITSGSPLANRGYSRFWAEIRAGITAAKLTGAVLTSLPTDNVMAGMAGMFRGSGFFRSFTGQVSGLLHGRPKGEQAQIAALLNEGYDGLIDHILHPFAAQDTGRGIASRSATWMFKWTGMTWGTDVARSVAARIIASEMGSLSTKAHGSLSPRYRATLARHGIGATEWDAMRFMARKADNGKTYLLPDMARSIPDDALQPFVDARLAGIPEAKRTDAMMTRFREDARRNIEMSLRRFVADETNYGIIETDSRSRRLTLRGTQAGTAAGEVLRFVMQFKGFPIAFTERVLGRAVMGGPGETAGQRFMSNIPHIGTLMATLTAAGYLSMTLKDAARGYWPPREPNAKTLAAAAMQGGAMGIFGDFLFADVNRFGNSALETMAGPGFSDFAKLNNMFRKSVRGETKGLEAFNLLHDNVPMLNLWYTRVATEVLYANAMREWLSPGYLRRRDANRYKQYKQERMTPDNLRDALN
jgi:hypothetical protein